jgi:hypothetical protein
LKIQPAGLLLAAAGLFFWLFVCLVSHTTSDETGCLLLFDLPSSSIVPQHSRCLLKEHGGISELCWIGDDIIALGTTRGKIIVYSSRNETVS